MLAKFTFVMIASAIGMLITHEHHSSDIAVIRGGMSNTSPTAIVYRTMDALDGMYETTANVSAVSCTPKIGSVVAVRRMHEPSELRGQIAEVVVMSGDDRECTGAIDVSLLSEPPRDLNLSSLK